MARRLDRPEKRTAVRLELDDAAVPAVEDAAHAARLSLASYCRLVIEMMAARGSLTAAEVRAEADRRTGDAPPLPPAAPPKPRRKT